MIVSTDMTVKAALGQLKRSTRYSRVPGETTVHLGEAKSGDYHIYQLKFSRLGPNDIVVNYGENEKPFQFNVIGTGAAIQRHSATVKQRNSMLQDKVFDDWLMEKKQRRMCLTATGVGVMTGDM